MSTAEFGDPNLGQAPVPVPAPEALISPPTLSAPVPVEVLADPAPLAAPQPVGSAVPVSDMRDVPLGTLIFRAGLLTEEQLEEALQDGMQRGKRLGEVLLEGGLVSEGDLGRLLAGQKGLQFVELDSAAIDPAAVQLLPGEKARLHTVLPIGFHQGLPVVAVADPSNELVVENVRRALDSEPHLVVAGREALQRRIEAAYAAAPPAAPVEGGEAVAPPVAPTPNLTAQVPPVLVETVGPLTPTATEPVPGGIWLDAPDAVQPQPAAVQLPGLQPRLAEPEPLAPAQSPEAPALRQPIPEPTAILQAPEALIERPVVAAPTPLPAAEPFVAPEPFVAEPVVAPEPFVAEPVVAPEPFVATERFVVEPFVAPEPFVVEPDVNPAPYVASEPVVAALSAVAHEAVDPVASEPLPAPEPGLPASSLVDGQAPGPDEDTVVTWSVVLRLTDGDRLEIGAFHSSAEATKHAQNVVRQISSNHGWPFFGGRFISPDAIVSVDLAEPEGRWLGSAARRSAWAVAGQES